jgi:hypothetical protein
VDQRNAPGIMPLKKGSKKFKKSHLKKTQNPGNHDKMCEGSTGQESQDLAEIEVAGSACGF